MAIVTNLLVNMKEEEEEELWWGYYDGEQFRRTDLTAIMLLFIACLPVWLCLLSYDAMARASMKWK
jgi:hypothetical protein